jgi:hypothetical protein
MTFHSEIMTGLKSLTTLLRRTESLLPWPPVPNSWLSVAETLEHDLNTDKIAIERDKWRLADLIANEFRFPTLDEPGWRIAVSESLMAEMAERIATDFPEDMYNAPSLAPIRYVSAMLNTVEILVEPSSSLKAIEVASWDLARSEYRIERAFETDTSKIGYQRTGLNLACASLRKASQLRLHFEARGFLLEVGIQSASLFEKEVPYSLQLCLELFRRHLELAHHHVTGDDPYIVGRWETMGPMLIKSVFRRESERVSTLGSVIQTALDAHRRGIGSIRPASDYRDRGGESAGASS